MKPYVNTYIKALGYSDTDFIPCQITGSKGIDIHHIIGRGKSGADRIENLMAVTRDVHLKYGDKKKHMVYLLETHRKFLSLNGVKFDNQWFEEKINYYKAITIEN